MEEGVTFEPGAQVFYNGEATEEMRDAYSAELAVPENMGPTFIWLCADDPLVPNANSLRLASALDELKIPYELHVFEAGGHGNGLSEGTLCEGWYNLSVSFLKRLGTEG